MGTSLPGTILDELAAYVHPHAFPVEVDLVPGALKSHVYLHGLQTEVGRIGCWSYITDGLRAYGQKEVVFTIGIDGGGDPGRFPTDPLRFTTTLFQLASQGSVVDLGGITELGGTGFMGRRGLTYTAAQPLDGVPVPPSALAVVALTAEEVEVLKVGGQTRVLAALGQAYRHYPFPPWLDRHRGSIITPQTTQGTILAGIPHLAVPGTVRIEGTTILLCLRPEAAPLLATALAHLPSNASFALTTEIDPAADGLLVWQAGQQIAAAITPPGRRGVRASGCFVGFASNQPEDGGQLCEDGLMLFATARSLEAVRYALCSGQPTVLAGQGGKMGFYLEWLQANDQSPALWAESGVQTRGPNTPMPPSNPAKLVRIKQVIMLTSEAELAERVLTDELSTFCMGVAAIAEICLSQHANRVPWEVLIDFSIAPGGIVERRLMSRGEGVSETGLQALYSGIPNVAPPSVWQGTIAFQILFEIGGV